MAIQVVGWSIGGGNLLHQIPSTEFRGDIGELEKLLINSNHLFSHAVEEHKTDTLSSPDGTFSCGFYSNSSNAFTFSIWGSKVTLRKDGTMVLTDYNGDVVWQAEGNSADVEYAQLLNSGNLVMKNSSDTKLVSSTGLFVPGHYIFHFTDASILSLIYDNVDVHEIFWPNPDLDEYQNKRNRYNSTRLGFLDDAGNFVSSDFANQPLVASDQGAIFVLEVFFIAFAWFFVLRWELGASEIQAMEKGYKAMTSNFRRYSYKELIKATRKFKHELGRGGSGIVYKGILDDSRVVAVKMLENVRQCEEEFQAELRIIGRINHMNLVRIWGFCSQSSYRMLVTEYIENGSLANILFKDSILLEWKQRFVIALGVAKGLAYLHHECLEWVIHCDVKPENILLDSNLEPKIADFGLAKLLNRGDSNQNVSRVRGTIGYIAPEWISSLQITSKVDVYSYGVVLLELVLGKRVLDLAVDTDEEVHKVLRKLVGMLEHMLNTEELSSIHEVVDCRLSGQFNYIQVRTLIELAVSCLDEDRNKRPTMESIVQKLILAEESCGI
ncbi:hypothetical protein QOZ80_3AG0229900 [Eleusine coracana subsp. coracana]|nr:hypothetical protein QOZ80_3AG0229900 [Eleusine coracana subsp. coracana]